MFPKTRFIDTNGVWRQFFHLHSKMWGVFWALVWRDWRHAARRLADLQQSADTERHVIQRLHKVDVAMERALVIQRNKLRGYYQA